jgi:hypothetical protein
MEIPYTVWANPRHDANVAKRHGKLKEKRKKGIN